MNDEPVAERGTRRLTDVALCCVVANAFSIASEERMRPDAILRSAELKKLLDTVWSVGTQQLGISQPLARFLDSITNATSFSTGHSLRTIVRSESHTAEAAPLRLQLALASPRNALACVSLKQRTAWGNNVHMLWEWPRAGSPMLRFGEMYMWWKAFKQGCMSLRSASVRSTASPRRRMLLIGDKTVESKRLTIHITAENDSLPLQALNTFADTSLQDSVRDSPQLPMESVNDFGYNDMQWSNLIVTADSAVAGIDTATETAHERPPSQRASEDSKFSMYNNDTWHGNNELVVSVSMGAQHPVDIVRPVLPTLKALPSVGGDEGQPLRTSFNSGAWDIFRPSTPLLHIISSVEKARAGQPVPLLASAAPGTDGSNVDAAESDGEDDPTDTARPTTAEDPKSLQAPPPPVPKEQVADLLIEFSRSVVAEASAAFEQLLDQQRQGLLMEQQAIMQGFALVRTHDERMRAQLRALMERLGYPEMFIVAQIDATARIRGMLPKLIARMQQRTLGSWVSMPRSCTVSTAR